MPVVVRGGAEQDVMAIDDWGDDASPPASPFWAVVVRGNKRLFNELPSKPMPLPPRRASFRCAGRSGRAFFVSNNRDGGPTPPSRLPLSSSPNSAAAATATRAVDADA